MSKHSYFYTKIGTLEKTIAGEAQPFNHFMKETRERTSQTELRYLNTYVYT